MSAAIALTPATHTLEEYLALEAEAYRTGSDEKYEYLGGQIFAMAGAHPIHNKITARTLVALSLALRPRGCEVVAGDQRVWVGDGYVYPDLVVTCGEEQFNDSNPPSLLNPLVLVEVSSSTKERDLEEKLMAYFAIESVQEYWIVSTDRPLVMQYTRRSPGLLLVPHDGLDAQLSCETLGLTLALADLYDGVPFLDTAPGGDGESGA